VGHSNIHGNRTVKPSHHSCVHAPEFQTSCRVKSTNFKILIL